MTVRYRVRASRYTDRQLCRQEAQAWTRKRSLRMPTSHLASWPSQRSLHSPSLGGELAPTNTSPLSSAWCALCLFHQSISDRVYQREAAKQQSGRWHCDRPWLPWLLSPMTCSVMAAMLILHCEAR
ncbi:unnamed protein product [Periconia digitata]|uniref:Uncharacterized protein n=1 Tax=Periconia digitata TaxID=1303443 RepID=A0A9W4UNF2_9PLEO|nr:unnamed protein product [Periconia digitata]